MREFGGISCVALDQVRWLLTNPVKHLWTTACLTTAIIALSSKHLGIHAKKNLALLQIEHFKEAFHPRERDNRKN